MPRFHFMAAIVATAAIVFSLLTPGEGLAQFTAITKHPLGNNASGFGVAWGDFDGDGDPDLYISNDGPNLLLRNDGAGDFTDVTAPPLDNGDNGGAVIWGDYDNDGDLDLYLVNYLTANRLFRNEGAGGFTDVTSGPLGDTGPGQGAAWADYDRDGDIDLYVVNYGTPNKLLRNDGAGVFTDVTSGPLGDAGWGLCAAWGDYDNDGDPDLYITNDGPNRLLRNDGGGSFTRITGLVIEDGGPGQGAAWGDYDNDGDLDLYVANYGTANKLIRNDGGNVFTQLTAGPLGDTGNTTGVAWGDYDNDRDLDLYVVNDGQSNALLRNDLASSNRWLHVDLVGTPSNRSAIGACVKLVAGGVSQIQEVSGGSGYLSQNSLTVEFGLGSATIADSLVIRWPSGRVDHYSGVATNQRLTLVEQGGVDVPGPSHPSLALELAAPIPNPCRGATRLRFALPSDAVVRVSIHDLQGRQVASLLNGMQPAGWHALSWDGGDGRGANLAAGVYVVRLETGSGTRARKLVLVR
jgi:hypothetical protein